jgi:hypothetical protein
MSILTKLKDEELAIVDIIRHPVLGPEFIRNFNDIPEENDLPIDFNNDNYYTHTEYQKLMLCDFNHYVVFCTARRVGKSEALIDKVTFFMLNQFWGDQYITLLTPNQSHLNPIFRKLKGWLTDNNFLKHLVSRGGINSASFTIRLDTGMLLDCRIAGTTGTGQNVVGIHTPVIIIDEAAYFPWPTWTELQPCLNTFQAGYQMLIAGVPDGRREKSVLFFTDQVSEDYAHHRVTSMENPRFSQEDLEKASREYNGERSEDYIHMVLGQHGSPVFSVFDRANMKVEVYDTVYKELRSHMIDEDSQAGYRQILELPKLPQNAENCIFGIDLGQVEPSAIAILYMVNEKWYQLARLQWYGLAWPYQEKLIAYLDSKYNPSVIGIDESGVGKPTVQRLMMERKFAEHDFASRMVPVNYASTVSIGLDEDGKDIKVRTKQFSVEYLQQLVNTHRIVFSKNDMDLIVEFERTSFIKTMSGNIQFKTFTDLGSDRGADHSLAAYLSGFVGWYLKNESLFSLVPTVKLYSKTQWWTT